MTQYLQDEAEVARRRRWRRIAAFFCGAALWLGIYFAGDGEEWDTRSTAELELDAWARRLDLGVVRRECLDDRPRPSDGRVPCGVYFADALVCDADHLSCGTSETTVWCAGDDTLAQGCVWR